MANEAEKEKSERKIVIMKDGSYHVFGNIPLVHKTQVVSERGEPLTWMKVEEYPSKNIEGKDFYGLCRCGNSKHKPYCDGTHREVGFDGTETAETADTAVRASKLPGGSRILVRKDHALCMLSGFCGFADAGIYQLLTRTAETKIRALVIAMVHNCPSGALTCWIEGVDSSIEPDLPEQIAVTTEITSEGPIPGPLWVTGSIPIERADGKAFEPRNRITLCSCGQSCQKPLCDGTHRPIEERALRRKRMQLK